METFPGGIERTIINRKWHEQDPIVYSHSIVLNGLDKMPKTEPYSSSVPSLSSS